MTYKIVFDNGKPYEVEVLNDADLIKEIKEFYVKNRNSLYFDFKVYVEVEGQKGLEEDISETQFISEIVEEILREVEA